MLGGEAGGLPEEDCDVLNRVASHQGLKPTGIRAAKDSLVVEAASMLDVGFAEANS